MFESFSIEDHAVKYSMDLAKRMDCSLSFLALIPYDSKEVTGAGEDVADDLARRVTESLGKYVRMAESEEIDVDVEVRLGAPESELLKMRAETRVLKAAVWGSSDGPGDSKEKTNRRLKKLGKMLQCPVVIPSKHKPERNPGTES